VAVDANRLTLRRPADASCRKRSLAACARGFTRNQAYAIRSVAVDLRVSNAVDVPNSVVSALLPEAIFG
jgi:acetamidase/formamidase